MPVETQAHSLATLCHVTNIGKSVLGSPSEKATPVMNPSPQLWFIQEEVTEPSMSQTLKDKTGGVFPVTLELGGAGRDGSKKGGLLRGRGGTGGPSSGKGCQLESPRRGRAGLLKGLWGRCGQSGRKNSLSMDKHEIAEKYRKDVHSHTAVPSPPVPHLSPSPVTRKPFCSVERWAQLLSGEYPNMPVRAHFSRIFGLGSGCPSPKSNGPGSSPGRIMAVVCRGLSGECGHRLREV